MLDPTATTAEMAENDHEQWTELHQHNHQHPQMELMEIQQQIQQPNLQTQLMEQILDGFVYFSHRFERKNSAGVAAATTDSHVVHVCDDDDDVIQNPR